MAAHPLISICIPCYNGAKFVARTLDSLISQAFEDFEVIIADNHSTDESVRIIRNYQDSRIKLIQNESNLGLVGNWNKVLSLSTGKYVKLLCADDVLYPECLSRQSKVLEDAQNRGVVLTVCNRDVIDANDRLLLTRKPAFRAGRASGASLIRSSIRRGTNLIGEPAVGLFRREVLGQIGVLDSANPYLIDLAFWAEVLKHGDAFVDTESLAAFRISRDGASAEIGGRQAAYFRKFLRAIRTDKFYRAGMLDVMRGYLFSFQWALLRNLFLTLNTNHHGLKTSGSPGHVYATPQR